MLVETVLTGTSPLLQHNIRLANPDDVITRQIAAITGKRKKTEEDRSAIARLEFEGSLYVDQGRVVVPLSNIRKCLVEAAKVRKLGRQLGRALIAQGVCEPLAYSGPQSVAELLDSPEHYDQTLVGVSGRRVVRTRPIFRSWAVSARWELVTSVLDLDDFRSIAEQAGIIEGLGDNRIGGYGRFDAEVTEL